MQRPASTTRTTRQSPAGRIILLALLSLVLGAAGCTKKDSEQKPSSRLLKIAVIPKATNHEYWKAIHAGALKAQQELPGIQIVCGDQYAGATTDEAYKKAENLLEKYPELDGIFGACEPLVLGVLRALHTAGREGQVQVIGFDRSEKLTQAMREGKVHGLVLQDPIRMGFLAVKTMAAHLRGERVPQRIDTGSVVATPENMNEPAIAELLSPPVEKYLR